MEKLFRVKSSRLYPFLLFYTAIIAAVTAKTSPKIENRKNNTTKFITDIVPRSQCLKECACQLKDDRLFIHCSPREILKASSNANKTISYDMQGITNDTDFSAVVITYEGRNLTDLLLNISFSKIYVTGFHGQASVLWDYLANLGTESDGLYLKECRFTADLSDVDIALQNIRYVELSNVSLSFDNNNISLFSAFPKLTLMTINQSNISLITKNIFGKVPHLRAINLSTNQLKSFNDSVLSQQTYLTTLNISHNWLYSPAVGCNQPLMNLTKLDISYNNITSLRNGFCGKGILNIQFLDMSHNTIQMLDEGIFDSLQQLRQLNLHSNLITEMNIACFGCRLSSLQTLSIHHNNLVSLDLEVLTPLAGLKNLNLSHNQIQTISRDKINNISMPNGTHICEYSYNVLKLLQNRKPFTEFVNFWPLLEVIDLSHNNITLITQQHFEEFFKNTKHLFLGDNYINYVPRYGIEHLHRIETIDLSHNTIDWMDVGTFTNPHLQDIDLSHNKLKKIISMTFLYLPNLLRLDLSHNRLNYLYRLALYKSCKHGQLMILDLSYNKLNEDAIWKFMSTFHEMKSDNCKLSIEFQNNRIRYLLNPSSRLMFSSSLHESNPEFLRMWTHSYFNMSRNPLHCDCLFHKDLNLIQQINQDIFSQTGSVNGLFKWQYMVCERPNNVKGIGLNKARLILEKTCAVNDINSMKRQAVGCNKFTSVSVHEMDGTPCQKVPVNQTNFITATTVAIFGTLIGLLSIICILKKAGVIPKFSSRGKWYKVYMNDDDAQNLASVTLHYHKNDKSLVTSELVYFVQDCCPIHDIILQPCDTIAELISEHPTGDLVTNLFIVSSDLMQEIRSNREVQSHYESIIEQSQVSVFLIMGTRTDIESLYPTFWSKVKYRHNVYFVCGTDRLPKLQCVLKNTSFDINATTVY